MQIFGEGGVKMEEEYGIILHSGDHEDILIELEDEEIVFDSLLTFHDQKGSTFSDFDNEFRISKEVENDSEAWMRAAQLIGGLILDAIVPCPGEKH